MSLFPILLVDDEEGIRTVLSISLLDAGYAVDTAPDVDSALKLFREKGHPLVLTDIKMPGRSGIDLLREIKGMIPETEVIMFSGHADMDLAIQSLKYDASDFLTKPINPELLNFALERAGERIEMRQRLAEHTSNLEQLVEEKSAKLVEAERQLAANQLFTGLTSSLDAFAANIDRLSVFNHVPMFASIHTRDMTVASVNEHYKNRLGDLTGKESWSMYEETDTETDCPVCRTIASGEPVRSNEIVRCINDKHHSVMVDTVPIKGSDNEVEMVLEFMVDLNETRDLKEKLRKTQHQYQQLFDQSPCYISVQNRDMVIQSANARFKEHLGDYEGCHCFEKLMHRQSKCEECPLVKTFEDGETHQLETVVTNQKGEKVNILIWSAPIEDADGNINQAIEMITDITQIRKLQDRLTSLGLLLGSTAHGIKGLLTGIDGAIYRLGSGLEKKNFERIEDGFTDLQFLTDRVKQTVLDILYYAKKRELNWKTVDAARFTMNLYASYAAKAKLKDVILDLDMGASIGNFQVDHSILSSALGNIVENAIDACVPGKDEPGRVTLKVFSDPDQLAFKITDNGVGMDKETLGKLFTLFFSSKGSSGTGIGLFIAHEIVSQHNGTIHVDSEPGEGTSFTVTIPREISA